MKSEKVTSAKQLRKEARQRVYDKLAAALSEFKTGKKEKKFEKNLRRTSKLFAADLAKSMNKDRKGATKMMKKKAQGKTEELVHKTA